MLSRRQFLRIGTTVLGAAALASAIKADNTELPIILSRQQNLDELVQKESSPYVEKVIYDHDRSLIARADYNHLRRLLEDPRTAGHFNLQEYGEKLTEEDIKVIQTLPKFIKDVVVFGIIKFRGLTKSDDNFAEISAYPLDFGKGTKSDVYFFNDSFDKIYIPISKKDIEIPITERLRAILRHEYIHAKHIAEGIDLGNRLVINNSNFLNIDLKVKKFVGEVEAHLEEVEYSKQHFGKEHPVYWWSLGQLFGNTSSFYNRHIKNKKFSQYETTLIEYQLDKLGIIRPEAIQIFEKLK